MKGDILNIPAEKAWKMYRDNGIISQINHEMLASAEYVEGDGSSGSLRLFKLGPALCSYVKESIEKVEVESGQSHRIIDGDLHNMYNPYSHLHLHSHGSQGQMYCPEEKATDAALTFLKIV